MVSKAPNLKILQVLFQCVHIKSFGFIQFTTLNIYCFILQKLRIAEKLTTVCQGKIYTKDIYTKGSYL